MVDYVNVVSAAGSPYDGSGDTYAFVAMPAMQLSAQSGVVGDGVFDDTAAINRAANSAAAVGARLDGYGTYRISGVVTISCACDLSQAIFNCDVTGSVQVGTVAVLSHLTFKLPTIIQAAKTVLGWGQVAGSV